ncbi:carbohydrate-binding protein [Streptomyces camelliae]|uniref:Carbohydrate-binding protein n=1 Tax=Streptomyces camelliae TaxID=3004093 RepID=A0ABY7P859_9ACTN|nr:carbohydrate-binding protein [Streptomyces sp. HUAS 2-6]WBO65503.1 carbohydrate-binding protein [Streptomyces sp. HUAS 2-6]
MTPGDNGASTPEDDDPFGYLYADGQARGAQPPSGGYGYPNSVSRVRAVGERQYGQQAPYGQQPTYGQGVPHQQGGYGQPSAHYQAPETLPGGAPTSRQPVPPPPARRGPNTKGLLIGAIAVVAAVVIGISVAMLNGNSDENKAGNQASNAPTQSQSTQPSPSGSASAASGQLKTDAGALQLAGGAAKASDVKGAQTSDGSYVGGLNQVGASITWTVNNVPSDGIYTLFAHFSVPGQDQQMTVSINGKPFATGLPLKNYAHAKDGDLVNGWTTTYVWPTLNKGANTISISCQPGDKCNALIDQLWLQQGQHTRNG